MSNLREFMSNGLVIYLQTTQGSSIGTSEISSIYCYKHFYNIDSSSPWCCWGFDNPEVLLSYLRIWMKMRIKVCKFIWKNIGVRNYIKIMLSIFLLQFYNVETKTIFSWEFITTWKMIDLLMFTQTFKNISFSTIIGPHHIPIMSFSLFKPIGF